MPRKEVYSRWVSTPNCDHACKICRACLGCGRGGSVCSYGGSHLWPDRLLLASGRQGVL